jgi:hypothetical protein
LQSCFVIGAGFDGLLFQNEASCGPKTKDGTTIEFVVSHPFRQERGMGGAPDFCLAAGKAACSSL